MPLTPDQKTGLFDTLDDIPELSGAGVGYDDGRMCFEIRPSNHSSGLETYLVVEEQDGAQPSASPSAKSFEPPAPHPSKTFLQEYGREFIGAGLSCTGAGLAIAGLGSEVLATPVTLGGSLLLLTPTVAAALASSAQCGISLGRVVNAFWDSDANDMLDQSDGFQALGTLLDVVSLGGTALGALPTLRNLAKLRAEANLVGQSRQVLRAAMRKMSDEEFEVFGKEVTSVLDETRSAARQSLISDIRSGRMGGTYTRVFLSQRLQQEWAKQLAIALGGTASTVAGSAAPAKLSSSSGVLNSPGNIPAAWNWAGRTAFTGADYVFHLIQE